VIDYLSLFNEPESVYTKIKYPEIRVLLRDYVGRALERSGLTTKIMLSEAAGTAGGTQALPGSVAGPRRAELRRRFITYTGTYYYLAHFSNFGRPGTVRVRTSGKSPGARVVVFRTPEKGHVADLLNSETREAKVNLVSSAENAATQVTRAIDHDRLLVSSQMVREPEAGHQKAA
jgi:hypothetical protein